MYACPEKDALKVNVKLFESMYSVLPTTTVLAVSTADTDGYLFKL
jgi:hypothetical protein